MAHFYYIWLMTHSVHTCPVCAKLHGTIWHAFKLPVHPHPHCKCRLKPVDTIPPDAIPEPSPIPSPIPPPVPPSKPPAAPSKPPAAPSKPPTPPNPNPFPHPYLNPRPFPKYTGLDGTLAFNQPALTPIIPAFPAQKPKIVPSH